MRSTEQPRTDQDQQPSSARGLGHGVGELLAVEAMHRLPTYATYLPVFAQSSATNPSPDIQSGQANLRKHTDASSWQPSTSVDEFLRYDYARHRLPARSTLSCVLGASWSTFRIYPQLPRWLGAKPR